LPYHEAALSKYHALCFDYAIADTPPPAAETLARLRLAVEGD
jgi:hypothetical protein